MNQEQIPIIIRVKGKPDEDLGEHLYEYPDSLEEAIETDGEEEVYRLYAYARKNKWREDKKRELKPPKVPAWLLKHMEDPIKRAAILKSMGIDPDALEGEE